MMSDMRVNLKPTLWRTARTLANADRLNLMRLVAKSDGEKGVVVLAGEANLPVPTASLYLRALNARGLISVKRSGRFVYYGIRPDRSLPASVRIQDAFRRLFARTALPEDWTERLIPVLRAYANPCREGIVRVLLQNGPLSYAELYRRSGLFEMTFLRHLHVLVSAEVVRRNEKDEYVLSRPRNSLSAAFLSSFD